ncbi:PrgI family protein [Cutibacterium granulosum]|uniref:PrgI family protein n=1 Tax=Cutibacterium granulosum TaxID=33011 RepID=UPI002B227069|nr:PrgI family protein [Cutibacterium granulosum]MEA5655091.1 PrgI family protein [Cutibacterium granulosum]
MALEVKVYKNIDEFKPKLFFGLTWRQLLLVVPLGIVAVVWSTLGAATMGGTIDFIAGWCPAIRSVPTSVAQFPISDTGQFVFIILFLLAALFGWAKPMKMNLETVVSAAWRHYQRPRVQKLFVGGNHDRRIASRHIPCEVHDPKSWAKPVVKDARTGQRAEKSVAGGSDPDEV